MKLPWTFNMGLVAALSALLLLTRTAFVTSDACEPQEQNYTVASTADAALLLEALGCTGGTFAVDWIGHVVVETTFRLSSNTTLTITGADLTAAADGNGTTQLFYLDDATLQLADLQLVNGYASPFGGAILLYSSTLSWTGTVVFAYNTVSEYEHGGGALNAFGSVINATRATTTFLRNSVPQQGGAVFISDSKMYVTGNTTFEGNSAGWTGGALYAKEGSEVYFAGTTVVTNNSALLGGAFGCEGINSPKTWTYMEWQGITTIENNRAASNGGGLSAEQHCRVSGEGGMTFANNTAVYNGGAVALNSDSELSVVSSTFHGNSAGATGGAVYAAGNLKGLTYHKTVFEYNSAASGGAIATLSVGLQSPNSYTNCIFRNNSATATGGAVEASVGQDNFLNSSFVNNSAGAGGALRVGGTASMSNVRFEHNSAQTDAPAVINAGTIEEMHNVSFDGNSLHCESGSFLEYEQNDDTARYMAVCDGCPEWDACSLCTINDGDDMPTCSDSLQHTFADEGATLESLVIEEGYWRATTMSKEILKCYNEDACLGGQTEAVGYCAEGYVGPYCSVCEEGYATTIASTCATCSGSNGTATVAVAVVMMLAAVGAVAFLVAYLVYTELTVAGKDRLHNKIMRALPLQSIKIVIVVWQILTQFTSVVSVTFPEVYEDFLKAIDVVNLDLGWMVSAGCIWPDITFHHRLVFSTLGPLVALSLLGGTYAVALRRIRAVPDDAVRARVRNEHMSALLLLTFLVYSSVSSMVFRMFACEKLDDGNDYLRADYRIKCTDMSHRALQAYAGIMILVYPVGIPLFYGVLLYRLRDILGKGSAVGSVSSIVTSTSDLWSPYRRERFYYEVVECFRRIALTGIVVFIFPGTAAQIIVTIMISFVFLMVSEVLMPYESPFETWLSRGGHIVVLCTFFAALLYKVDVSDETENSQRVFGGVMVTVHICLVLAVVAHSIGIWRSHKAEKEENQFPRSRHGRLSVAQRKSSLVLMDSTTRITAESGANMW